VYKPGETVADVLKWTETLLAYANIV
jgi:hypothetical protein